MRAFHFEVLEDLEGDMSVGEGGSENIYDNFDNDDSPVLRTGGRQK